METDLNPAFLMSEQFRQVSAEWIALVRRNSLTKTSTAFDPAELKLGTLLSQLTAKQATSILAATLGLLAGVGALSFQAGKEWQQSTTQSGTTTPAVKAPPAASQP